MGRTELEMDSKIRTSSRKEGGLAPQLIGWLQVEDI